VVCVLPVCVTDDEAAARARAAKVFAVYDTLPSYKAMLDIEGAGGPRDVAIVGDEAAVRQQLDELAAIGVTDFVAGEFATGDDAARTRAFLRDVATGSR
jgi:5,10-methylenetetrahydromethanopterin reductase